ncbi:MAG: MATE family efflux transporter [Endomicrobiales bacterium]|nr:MATE family efflux transporter [Endomicrobiales bacterium]
MKKIKEYLIWRWNCEGGYREFFVIAIPLILSTGAWSIQHFVDRMFLTWYSSDTIAAAMPAGILNFAVMSLFIGTVSYVDTFVAQYFGAKQYKKIGPALWQGIYLSLAGGLIVFIISFFSESIFGFIGHEPSVMKNEIIYFRILCYGAFPALASAALVAFYAGRGETWTIMWINFAGTFINLVFDYLLIFGIGIFPEMGIKGAAIATVMSGVFTFLVYLFLIFRSEYILEYATAQAKLKLDMLKQIINFGLPSGVQFFVDMFGFAVFISIVGRLGTINLAASNIAFNINTISFLPMIGCGIAVSIMVGQYIGMGRADIGQRSTYTGFSITFAYMALISALYVLAPSIFIKPFAMNSDPKDFVYIFPLVVVLLRFVAVYSLFDTMNIIFASAIKGAGDTRFVMYVIIILSSTFMIIPYIAIVIMKKSLYVAWTIASIYVAVLGFSFLFRFLQGKWKSMNVIGVSTPSLASTHPEVPVE